MGHSGKKGKKGTVVGVKLVRADRKNPPCVIAGGLFFFACADPAGTKPLFLAFDAVFGCTA